MSWKDLLKPDYKKLVVFLISVSLVTLLLQSYDELSEILYYFSFPFTSVTRVGHDCLPCGIKASYEVDYLGLAANLIFWYVFACVVVELYNMVKK